LNELTNQILDLQKLDAGNLKLNLTNTDIVAHMKGIISSFEGFCNKTQCKLLFISQHSSVECLFDKDKITKITSNLCQMHSKNSYEGGEVNLELTFSNRLLAINVKDKGRGIPKEHLDNVFKRYYQLETSNTQHEGTGIGLAYVKELAELLKVS